MMNGGITATVGDKIRVAVKVGGNVLFRDTLIQVMVRPVKWHRFILKGTN